MGEKHNLKKRSRSRSESRRRLAMVTIVLLTISTLSAILFLQLPKSNTPNPDHNNSSDQIKILNKQIPPGYVMGFTVEGGPLHGMNVVFIDDPGERVSIRFTCKLSGTVTKLAIYAFAYKGQPVVHIGLQEDNAGRPSNTWMSGNSFGDVQLPSNYGFQVVQLGSAANITKGQVYHIVVEAAQDQLNGTAAVTTYQTNGLSQPLNPEDPDLMWNDTKTNVLLFNGQDWQEQNKWPIFVITYSDSRSEGQPYSIVAQWVVWGSTWVGQALIPASDYSFDKMAFAVSLGSSIEPQDKLYFQIKDSNNSVLTQGILAERTQLSRSVTWVEVTLPTPVKINAGKLYRLVVMSPSTDLANAYYLYGHEFSYNTTIGYGGLQHQLTSSHSGGTTWADNPDADAIFKITTAK